MFANKGIYTTQKSKDMRQNVFIVKTEDQELVGVAIASSSRGLIESFRKCVEDYREVYVEVSTPININHLDWGVDFEALTFFKDDEGNEVGNEIFLIEKTTVFEEESLSEQELDLQTFLEDNIDHYKVEIELRGQGDRSTISEGKKNICTVTRATRTISGVELKIRNIFGGISEEFYDKMVNKFNL